MLSGSTVSYSYPGTSNRLSSAGSQAFTYDASGNTTSDLTGGAGNTYTYDKRGRYSTLTTAGSVAATYLYDAVGERVSKQTGGSNTHYQYDESGRIIGENNGSTGANIREYIYLNNQPLAQIESGGSIYYIHNDHLGTPQKMTDATPAIVWDRVQQPFGETWSVTGSVVNNFRFPGQYYDAESGLNQNMMRDYQSGTGRYIQSDPIGLIGAYSPNMNLYGYANQNPIRYTDRLGQDTRTDLGNFGAKYFGMCPPVDKSPKFTNPPKAANSNNPKGTCPFSRELPEGSAAPGNRACIYKCDDGQRIEEISSTFSCREYIFPSEGKPYSPITIAK